ncbi:hypothetical protein NIIDMKKI_72570 [Mycobacterium kansasii]|uniref:PE-PPE domain-containing protein n=1 Tax=Mycobacterium kansasii TaxID=1768 RepID=A0A7G1IM67_MYCKA|nr:hypothetical protein NIIDMKKI_72570 [Mycobacterium kansasii]
MGGTFDPQPFPVYVTTINGAYIQFLFPGANAAGLTYPAQFWPLTLNLGNLTINESIAQGVVDLNNAITSQLNASHNVIDFGFSQSSVVATNEMYALMNLPLASVPIPANFHSCWPVIPPPRTGASLPASRVSTSPSWT